MKRSVIHIFIVICLIILDVAALYAQGRQHIIEVEVDGSVRHALVIPPARPTKGKRSPLVFVFHGRTGTMEGAAKRMAIHKHLPNAYAVYPQGLRVEKGRFDGAGWVMPTQADKGRDIALFDTLLDTILTLYDIDRERIYAMGHSNGGGFTHALWAMRGEHLTAVAASCSGAGHLGEVATRQRPKPAFFVGGKNDKIAPLQNVQRCIDRAIATNRCQRSRNISPNLVRHVGTNGNDVMVYIHDGGHKFQESVLPHIARFFSRHKRR